MKFPLQESKTVGLKLNIQKTKIMASSPITSWGIDRETVETVSNFFFLGSTIIADDDCSHEIKRCLLLGRKVMTNLNSIFKSRDITLLTKVRLVKALVFPVVMYGCESWTVKKAERRRIDAFTSICVHPSNKVALSIGADNAMRMWNLIKGRLGYVRKLKEQAFKILFSPDGSEYFFRFIFILDMQSCIPRCAVCTRSVMENNYSS